MKSRLKIDHERARREILARYGKPSTDIEAMAYELGFVNRSALIGYAGRMREDGYDVPRRPTSFTDIDRAAAITRVYAEARGDLCGLGEVSVTSDTQEEADAFLGRLRRSVAMFRAKRDSITRGAA